MILHVDDLKQPAKEFPGNSQRDELDNKLYTVLSFCAASGVSDHIIVTNFFKGSGEALYGGVGLL